MEKIEYPKHKYHPEKGVEGVHSAEHEKKLVGYYDSPADYGVETCPSDKPCPIIAAKKPGSKKEPKKSDEPKS